MIEDIERQLEEVNVDGRRQAVLQLGRRPQSGYGEHVRLLLKAMLDVNWRVRKTAVDVLLENYPTDSYVNGLISLLYTEDNAGARNSAIEALIRLEKNVTGYLIDAYNTKNPDVKKFIVDIIGQANDRKAVPFLIACLREEDENVRASVVEYLGNMGEPSVVDALIEILESGDLWAAYPAADALGRIGDRRALPALLNALEDKTLREPALKAIGRLGDEDSLEYLTPYVSDRSKAVCFEAMVAVEKLYHRGVSEVSIVESLKKHHGEKLIDLLLELAWSTRPDIRGASILMLGLLKDERALPALLELSSDDDFRDDIKRAMVYIGKDRPEALLPLCSTVDLYLKRFLCEVAGIVASPVYSAMMRKCIEDEDGHIRALAALGLSNIGEKDDIAPIMKLLTDPYMDVQEAAVKAVARFKEFLDIKSLVKALESKDTVLRRNIILLLGIIGAVETVSAIGFRLKDDDPSVRKAVVTSLSALKTGESPKYLITALSDEDPDIRSSAALALGETSSDIEPLRLLVNDPDDMVRVSAAKAFGMMGDKGAITDLIGLLRDSNGFVVASAVESLGKLGGDSAMSAIAAMLGSDDREIKMTAIRTLSLFKNSASSILPFLRDADWALRAAAVESLIGHREEHIRDEIKRIIGGEEDPIVKKMIKVYLDA